MAGDDQGRRSEREQTDQNLFAERERSDKELANRRLAAEQNADAVVRLARERARDVLRSARERADTGQDGSDPSAEARRRVAQERQGADEALAAEYAAADEQLLLDRESGKRALAELLAKERASTDTALRIERDRADGLVASRDEFLAIVSHDIRNLTGSIALSLEAIARTVPPSSHSDAVAAIARFRRISGQLTRLVNDLIDVSSIEARRLLLKPALHDVAEMVLDSVDVFRPVANAKGVVLTAEPMAPGLRLSCDRERILQVLANLLGNAIKFTPNGGRVQIHLEEAGPRLRISVTDTGPGIAAANVDRIFERFWQATPKDGRGLGLGLFIARAIVEAHGGSIDVDSVEGRGSTFHFDLPRPA